MKSFFASLALIATLATSATAQFTINSLANVVVCQPSLITWTGGNPPYFLSILPGDQPTAPALLDLGQQNGTSVTWRANLPVGTTGFLQLRDNTGTIAQSGKFTVLTGSDISCVGQAISTTSGPAGQTPPANTPTTAATGTTPNTAGNTSKTNTPTPTPSTGSAVGQFANVGAVVMMAGAALALVV
ncbi:hypothetical protein B0H34DRAFT_678849 [Crassisporium funariophilum]|nr:hypothetical protein B0H34DRAFT_678849 [Crassisporium funariophilum]